jgi:hypothetical protein
MNRTQSGVALILVGIVMNVLGRLLTTLVGPPQNPALAMLALLWMVAAVVIGLFGLFRLITGMVRRGQ